MRKMLIFSDIVRLLAAIAQVTIVMETWVLRQQTKIQSWQQLLSAITLAYFSSSRAADTIIRIVTEHSCFVHENFHQFISHSTFMHD